MNQESFPINIRIIIVADDFRGYGKTTKYVGKKGLIIGWKVNPTRTDGKVPIIKLDSGEIICSKKLWWSHENGEKGRA